MADFFTLTVWWSPLLILAMGAATYATRAGGLWLIKRVTVPPPVERWLSHLPGAIFIALVTPMVVQAGPPAWAGAAVTLVLARLTGSLLLAMAAGTAVVALLRLANLDI